MNQTQISNKTKISQSFLSEVLSGKKKVSWAKAKRLAKATGTDPSFWMDAKPEQLRKAIEKAA